MNSKILNSLVLAICGILFWIIVADINGKWNGVFDYNGQLISTSFTFKKDGDSLTGTTVTPLGTSEIRDGKIEKGILNFKVDINGSTAVYVGQAHADSINLKVTYQGGEYTTTLRRSNEQ